MNKCQKCGSNNVSSAQNCYDCGYFPIFPSQPNSEESQYVKGAGGCCEKCEIYLDYKDSYQCNNDECECHSPKPEEKMYQCLNPAHRELGIKFPCIRCREIPNTTEERCGCGELRSEHGSGQNGYCTPKIEIKGSSGSGGDTSDEWAKKEIYTILDKMYADKNYIDCAYEDIKSLISQSEQRVRKEIVEELQEYIGNYQVDLCENSQQFKNDIINLISK